jgi:hypothetical protein
MRLAYALLLTVVCCGGSSNRITAKQMVDAINKQGAKTVATKMNINKGIATWNYVEDRVASGSIPWLKIAVELKPYTDAGIAEGLDNSVADALPKAPEQVVGMLGETFHTDRICSGAQFIEMPKKTVLDFLKKARIAVQEINNSTLAKKRDACLSEIDSGIKDMSK